jgi:hypothetical protein
MLWKRRWFSKTRLVALVAVEGVIAVLLCSWQTGIDDTSPSIINRIVEMRSKGFPVPNNEPLAWNNDDNQKLQPLWHNTNIFQKRVSHDGFNSFWPEQHVQLQQRWPILFKEMKAQPLVYIADSVIRAKDYVDRTNEIQWGNALAVLPDTGELPVLHPFRREDSCAQRPTVNSFSATSIEVDVDALCRSGLLVIQQQHLPGWKAWMDGNEIPIVNVNGCAMGIAFTRGKHKVELVYALSALPWLRVASWSAFIIVLLLLAIVGMPALPRVLRVVGIVMLLIMVRGSFFTRSPPVIGSYVSHQYECIRPSTFTELYHNPFNRPDDRDSVFYMNFGKQPVLVLSKGRNDWSAAYEVDVDSLRASNNDALIVDVRFGLRNFEDAHDATRPRESFIVLSVERDGAFSFYRTERLHEWVVADDDLHCFSSNWSCAQLVANVDQLSWRSGKLKAYVWNNDLERMLLDDFRVSVMPWDSLGVTY